MCGHIEGGPRLQYLYYSLVLLTIHPHCQLQNWLHGSKLTWSWNWHDMKLLNSFLQEHINFIRIHFITTSFKPFPAPLWPCGEVPWWMKTCVGTHERWTTTKWKIWGSCTAISAAKQIVCSMCQCISVAGFHLQVYGFTSQKIDCRYSWYHLHSLEGEGLGLK